MKSAFGCFFVYTSAMTFTFTLRLNQRLAVFLSLILLGACSTLKTPPERLASASGLAEQYDWQAQSILTTDFDIMSYQPSKTADRYSLLTIYIEGDGLAWLTKRKISSDPTPINPVGLKLALNHPQGNATYLARPCQYTGGKTARNCNKHHWTDARFSEQVIASSNEALNSLKDEFKAEQLQLVGYSGGGAVAALIAARRDDVVKLITIAGNLDHQAWTTHHNISPLTDSLNPADYQQQLSKVKQIHFVGDDDKVMPPFIARDFVAGLASNANAKAIVVPNQSHGCCWESIWAELMSQQSK